MKDKKINDEILLSNEGLSFLHVILLIGALSLIAPKIMQMTQTMNQSTKLAEAKNEERILDNHISHALIDKEICTNTFASLGNITGSTEEEILVIKNASGNPLFQRYSANNKMIYGNSHFKIESMILKSEYDEASKSYVSGFLGSPNSIGRGTLEVKLIRINQSSNDSTITKRYSLKIATGPTGNIDWCYNTINDDIMSKSVAEACKSKGGVYHSDTNICRLANLLDIKNTDLVSIDLLQSQSNDSLLKKYNKDIASFLLKGRMCPDNYYLRGIKSDGNLICDLWPGSPPPDPNDCQGGSQVIASPDSSSSCIFNWPTVPNKTTFYSNQGDLIVTNRGYGYVTCNNGVFKKNLYCLNTSDAICPSRYLNWPHMTTDRRCHRTIPDIAGKRTMSMGDDDGYGLLSVVCYDNGREDKIGGLRTLHYCAERGKGTSTCPSGTFPLFANNQTPPGHGPIDCRCNWPETPTGQTIDVNCTNGAVITKTCDSTGGWSNIKIKEPCMNP